MPRSAPATENAPLIPKSPSQTTWSLGSPLRYGLGILLWLVALTILANSLRLEFGIGWTATLPAIALLFPATGLLRRRRIIISNDQLHLHFGWGLSQKKCLSLSQGLIELVPTAGAMAVVFHGQEASTVLATWIRPSTAHQLAIWMEQHIAEVTVPPPPRPTISSKIP